MLRQKPYQRKQIENRQFRSNAVSLTLNFRQKGTFPTIHFCMDANEYPTTLPLTVFTRISFVADFLQAKCDFTGKTAVSRFKPPPPLGDLEATYDNHTRLTGKRAVDFLLVLIKLFPQVLRLRRLRAIIGSKSAISLHRGLVDPKFRLEGSPPQPFFFSENQAKCCFAWYKNLDTFFFGFVTMHAFDRQTDGRTDRRTDRILIARPRLHSMQRGKNGAFQAQAMVTQPIEYESPCQKSNTPGQCGPMTTESGSDGLNMNRKLQVAYGVCHNQRYRTRPTGMLPAVQD